MKVDKILEQIKKLSPADAYAILKSLEGMKNCKDFYSEASHTVSTYSTRDDHREKVEKFTKKIRKVGGTCKYLKEPTLITNMLGFETVITYKVPVGTKL